MSIILNIFENIIKFNEKNIFIIFDISGEIWFGLKDLLKTLGYTHKIKHIYDFNINKNNIKVFKNIKVPRSTEVPSNFQYKTKFINEYGLYELLSKSNKICAKQFMEQYFTKIMPHIRKHGEYIMTQNDKNKIYLMNNKINNLKKENKDLLINQTNIIYPKGHAIYIIKQKKYNKIYYKIGYPLIDE